MVISLYILAVLWVVSIFTFIKIRISLSSKKIAETGIHNDWVCISYLRISGILILFAILSIINR